MITGKQEQRFSPAAAGRTLSAPQLDALWAAYMADRGDWQLRNRLVEYYLPQVRRFALSIAKKMRLRDRDSAVGEVLAALVESIVPGYDGTKSFERWARVCARRKLIDQFRAEEKEEGLFAQAPPAADGSSPCDLLPDREPSANDVRFVELTAGLSDRQAMVLWLRYYRGASVEAVAALLAVSPRGVEIWTREALAELKHKSASCAS
jgi:RNA polymerase sigma factor (sigma-70 family)